MARGLAPETMIETAEGPVRMAEMPNKGFAVMTRVAARIGFRQLIKLVAVPDIPRVRVTFDTGQSVVAAADHPFFRAGMMAVAARELAPGDVLETAFTYRQGYVPPDLADFQPQPGVRVLRVEPTSPGEVMTGTVRDAHALFLTAGVLCGE